MLVFDVGVDVDVDLDVVVGADVGVDAEVDVVVVAGFRNTWISYITVGEPGSARGDSFFLNQLSNTNES